MKIYIYSKAEEVGQQVREFLKNLNYEAELLLTEEDLVQGLRKHKAKQNTVLIALPGLIAEAIYFRDWLIELDPFAIVQVLPTDHTGNLHDSSWQALACQVLKNPDFNSAI